MKSLLVLIFSLATVCSSIAQRPQQLSKNGEFLDGVHTNSIVLDSVMYFSAFTETSGWQIYGLTHQSFWQASRFDVYGEGNKNEDIAGGCAASYFVEFQGSAVTFCKDRWNRGGVYRTNADHKVVKVLGDIVACSKPAIHEDELVFEVIYTDKNLGLAKRIISLSKDWQVIKGGKNDISRNYQTPQETISCRNEAYAAVSGKLAKFGENGYQTLLPNFSNVSGLFVVNDQIYFSGIRKGSSAKRLYRFLTKEKIEDLGGVYPNKNMINPHDPLVTNDKAYFVADPDRRGLRLYELTDKVEEIIILASNGGYRDFQGMDVLRDQLFICVSGSKGPLYDLYQYDQKNFVERNPSYVQNVRDVKVVGEYLVYRATEFGREAIYTSEPVMPPQAQNDTFSIYDFWQNGDLVGTIQASDPSGRIRYHIIGGDPNNTFEIDYFNGDIRVVNSNGVNTRIGKPYELVVKVENRSGASTHANIRVIIKKGESLDTKDLHETLMFFPNRTKKSTLTTRTLREGEVVRIYNQNFVMVDEIVVHNREIVIPKLRPGVYILNVKNSKNLYQKIEIN